MKTVREIFDVLGRGKIALALSVSDKSLSRAAVDNRCPSSWWLILSQLCAAQGVDCPPCLFAFKPAPSELSDRVTV